MQEAADWRDQILKEFTPKVAPLTLVADPDGLLLEEALLEAIRERGFELLPFEDHVAFRFACESGFRSRRDRGESTDLVIVLEAERHDLATLPHDLLRAGRQLSFGLGELFPRPRTSRCCTSSTSRPRSSGSPPTCCASCCGDIIGGSLCRASWMTA